MKDILDEYKKWKKEHPDEDYQYDEIHNFMDGLTRGQMQQIMEHLLITNTNTE